MHRAIPARTSNSKLARLLAGFFLAATKVHGTGFHTQRAKNSRRQTCPKPAWPATMARMQDTALTLVIDRVRAAAAARTPLRICGGSTKDFHGLALHGDVLDMRGLAGILSYEPSELVVTVRAGTPLAELEAALAEKGQCLPFEPPRLAPGGTVGGMVATGWSGPARASVGAVRDYVLGVSMVNGKGEPLTFGGQVMKNVAGYDVSRLMVGAWGTLGVLTEISLKVLPVAPAEATLRFECDQATALHQLQVWGGKPLPLNASCWVLDDGVGTLYVRLRGAAAAVEAACASMPLDLPGTRQDNAAVAADWDACRDQTLPWFTARTAQPVQPAIALWRLSVPATAPVLHLPEGASTLVEWHGALRWVQAPVQHGNALRDAARQVGGSASLFIASKACITKASGGFDLKNHALEQIHTRLKHSFDPQGILNPGRMAAQW